MSNINRNVATDAAGFTLHYYMPTTGVTNDYTSVNTVADFEADMASTAFGTGISNQYNGNIAGMTATMLDATQFGMEVQGRAFRYDQLYRIKLSEVYHMNGTAVTNNQWQSSYTQNNRYKEAFTYDWNGNIKTVDRYAGNVVAGTAVKSDGLTYNYDAESNLLRQIQDTQNDCAYADDLDDQTSSSNYRYDAIGELTKDGSERINAIEWTPYGKVRAVRKDQANNTNACTSTEYEDADVEFLYTAGQQRLCKIIKPHKSGGAGIDDQKNWIYYWYVYDAGGNVMGVYKQKFEDDPAPGSGDYIVHIDLEENAVYGSGRTGIRHADDESDYEQHFTTTVTGGRFNTPSYGTTTAAYSKTHYNRALGYKQYEVANHLGNMLVTISDKRLLYATGVSPTEVDWYVADVQSYTDYYVFGAPQTGRAGGSYRYGFNGMEQDAETKGERLSYTTEFRQYDPRVGRWMSPDPIVKPWESPYAAFANNPVLFVDPSGLNPSGGPKLDKASRESARKAGYSKKDIRQAQRSARRAGGTVMYENGDLLVIKGDKDYRTEVTLYRKHEQRKKNSQNNTEGSSVKDDIIDLFTFQWKLERDIFLWLDDISQPLAYDPEDAKLKNDLWKLHGLEFYSDNPNHWGGMNGLPDDGTDGDYLPGQYGGKAGPIKSKTFRHKPLNPPKTTWNTAKFVKTQLQTDSKIASQVSNLQVQTADGVIANVNSGASNTVVPPVILTGEFQAQDMSGNVYQKQVYSDGSVIFKMGSVYGIQEISDPGDLDWKPM